MRHRRDSFDLTNFRFFRCTALTLIQLHCMNLTFMPRLLSLRAATHIRSLIQIKPLILLFVISFCYG